MLNVKEVLSIIGLLTIGTTIAFFTADLFYRSNQEANRIRYQEDCENAGLDVLERFSGALSPSILAACLSVGYAENEDLYDMFIATASLSSRETIGYLSRLHGPAEASDFEENMSLLYGQNVTITDVGDEEREEAWVLAYYYPEVVEFIGLDVYSEQTRIDTVDKMVSSNRSYIAPRLDLAIGRAGLYTLEPVFSGWDSETHFGGKDIVGAVLTLFYVDEFFGSAVLAKFLSANPKSQVRMSISGEMVYDNFVNNNTLETVSATSTHTDDFYVYNRVVPGSLVEMEVTMSVYKFPSRSVLFYSTFVGSWALVGMTVLLVLAQRKRREAEAASNFKTKFIADMSHEIRTPMNGIMGMSELLSDQELSHACKEYIRVIRSCASSLMNIINDILDMSKIGANMMDLRPVSFRIINAVTHTVENVWVSFNGWERTGVQTVVIIGKDVPIKVVADDVRYKQILSNLFTNALKFTDRGTITISVRADATDDKDDNGGVYKITTSVADTGIGMSPESLKKCFQSFAQVHTNKRNVGGTGLGLSISKQLSNLMGGDMSCSSTLGKGTTFSYDVLVDTVAPNLKTTGEYRRVFHNENKDVKNLETEVYEQSSFSTSDPLDIQIPEGTIPVQPHILVVDDNKVNRLVARKILGTLGVKVDTCDNGLQAVQECDVQKYSAVLMDMVMPVMGGVDATKQIRASGGFNSKTPIIFLSANVLGEHLQQCQDAGGDGFLSKPVKRSLVLEKISEHLAIGEVAHVMNHWGPGQV